MKGASDGGNLDRAGFGLGCTMNMSTAEKTRSIAAPKSRWFTIEPCNTCSDYGIVKRICAQILPSSTGTLVVPDPLGAVHPSSVGPIEWKPREGAVVRQPTRTSRLVELHTPT